MLLTDLRLHEECQEDLDPDPFIPTFEVRIIQGFSKVFPSKTSKDFIIKKDMSLVESFASKLVLMHQDCLEDYPGLNPLLLFTWTYLVRSYQNSYLYFTKWLCLISLKTFIMQQLIEDILICTKVESNKLHDQV